jgi:sulfoxide reductase heme-binding subunit YedZ
MAVWYLMRGTGVVSLVLLTGVFALGIATRRRARIPTLPRFATLALHRSLSLLAVTFIAIHVVTALVDPYAAVVVVDLVVPFTASSQPLWIGLGALALDLVLALIVTGLLRRRIGRRAFRAVHWGAYAAWPLALVHAVGIGSDTATPWLRSVGVACVLVVAAGAAWRWGARPAQTTRASQSRTAPTTSVSPP